MNTAESNNKVPNYQDFGTCLLLGAGYEERHVIYRQLVSGLIKQGKKVGFIDFLNEYGSLVKEMDGYAYRSDKYHSASYENPFVYVHFGKNVAKKKCPYDLCFLLPLIDKIDWLIVDEAALLHEDYYREEVNPALEIKSLCTFFTNRNKTIQLFFSVTEIVPTREEDVKFLQRHFWQKLLFKGAPVQFKEAKNKNKWKRGETILYRKGAEAGRHNIYGSRT